MEQAKMTSSFSNLARQVYTETIINYYNQHIPKSPQKPVLMLQNLGNMSRGIESNTSGSEPLQLFKMPPHV